MLSKNHTGKDRKKAFLKSVNDVLTSRDCTERLMAAFQLGNNVAAFRWECIRINGRLQR